MRSISMKSTPVVSMEAASRGPRQLLAGVAARMTWEVQIAQDLGDRVLAIQDVEMNAGDAVGPEVFRLAGGALDADFAHRPVVVGEAFKQFVQLGRNGGAAQGGEPPDLGRTEDGEQAGDDGRRDAGAAAARSCRR